MADKTKIEWTRTIHPDGSITSGSTWNPVTGCTKVSAGCKHCYAERDWARLSANPKTRYYDRSFTDVRCHTDVLDLPMRWKKPRRIFVNSMSDLFHDAVPDDFIADVFRTMAWSHQHSFQVLTKRPERMLRLLTNDEFQDSVTDNAHECADWPWPLPNVWIGVSVEDQATTDERIPLLLQTPAAVRWISAEPLLGRVDLCETFGMWWNQTMGCFESSHASGFNRNPINLTERAIDWVVVGGESGPKARPMHPDWARSLRDQCEAASVAFLMKQWGEWAPTAMEAAKHLQFAQQPTLRGEDIAGTVFGEPGKQFMWPVARVGKKLAGRLLDGVEHNGYPEPRP